MFDTLALRVVFWIDLSVYEPLNPISNYNAL